MQEQQINLPKVAVVICNYNYGEWIVGAINSAAAQDYPNKEIYIVDDSSTDSSIEVIENYCTRNNTNQIITADYIGKQVIEDTDESIYSKLCGINNCSIYLIQLKKNGGPSRARNKAIQKAAANGCQIFAVLDADDLWKQGKLSKSVVKILEDPNAIAGVYTDYQHLNVETNTLTYESKEPYSRLRLLQDCIIHSGCVINGMALQQIGLYDEDLRVCEDYNLWLRMSKHFLFMHIPEDLVIVRVQPYNSTNTVAKERWQRDYYLCKQRALGE